VVAAAPRHAGHGRPAPRETSNSTPSRKPRKRGWRCMFMGPIRTGLVSGFKPRRQPRDARTSGPLGPTAASRPPLPRCALRCWLKGHGGCVPPTRRWVPTPSIATWPSVTRRGGPPVTIPVRARRKTEPGLPIEKPRASSSLALLRPPARFLERDSLCHNGRATASDRTTNTADDSGFRGDPFPP